MGEQTLRSQLLRMAFIASLFLLLCSILFIVNQTAQAVALANTLSPVFGRIVLIFLVTVLGVIVIVPLTMIVRMPKALRPPEDLQSSEYQKYLRQLGARLKNYPHLAGKELRVGDRTEIEAALKILDAHVDGIIKKAATTIFVSTAISQNGMLDALMVASAQSRMVWHIAQAYNQRPSLRKRLGCTAMSGRHYSSQMK